MTGEKITEQNEDIRVLITYKGSAEIGKEFQDDYMILELVTETGCIGFGSCKFSIAGWK